ncbi:MAG: WYL domain-containing protein [Bacteroidales bacterium]|nr:WYL domain-containing protein [Bacteroidales bacterium]
MRLISSRGEKGISFAEIASRWESRFGESYPRRSFNNHREAIADAFGVSISCNRSTNRYHIEGGEDNENASSWLIDSFTVGNILSRKDGELKGRISIEAIPSGHTWLTLIMDAMTDSTCLELEYRKYRNSKAEKFTVRPYALKEDMKRWYLVGWCEQRNDMRVYALDRILSLESNGSVFSMPASFDVEEAFATSYGPYLNHGEKGSLIRLRAYGTQAAYLRDLPLHRTQEEKGSGDGYVDFSIFVVPNRQLVLELCKTAGELEVLAPESLREQVRAQLEQGLQRYGRK